MIARSEKSDSGAEKSSWKMNKKLPFFNYCEIAFHFSTGKTILECKLQPLSFTHPLVEGSKNNRNRIMTNGRFHWRFKFDWNSIAYLLLCSPHLQLSPARPHLSFLFRVEKNVEWIFEALEQEIVFIYQVQSDFCVSENLPPWQNIRRVSGKHFPGRICSGMINFVLWEHFSVSPNPRSPLSTSFGLNSSTLNSPNIANMSQHFKFLMPEKSLSRHCYSFSPVESGFTRSPNLSPIVKPDNSPSDFLKRRDPKAIK